MVVPLAILLQTAVMNLLRNSTCLPYFLISFAKIGNFSFNKRAQTSCLAKNNGQNICLRAQKGIGKFSEGLADPILS
jgi:hypothetical protein